MINALLFVSVGINLLLVLLVGFLLGQKARKGKEDPGLEAIRKIWNQGVAEMNAKAAKKGG